MSSLRRKPARAFADFEKEFAHAQAYVRLLPLCVKGHTRAYIQQFPGADATARYSGMTLADIASLNARVKILRFLHKQGGDLSTALVYARQSARAPPDGDESFDERISACIAFLESLDIKHCTVL